jgi:hypothetical protein
MVNNTLEKAWEIKGSWSFSGGTGKNQDKPQIG